MTSTDQAMLQGLIHSQRWGDLVVRCQQLLRANPRDVPVLECLVDVLRMQNRYEDLQPYLVQLLDLSPDSVPLNVAMGYFLKQQGNHPFAEQAFRTAMTRASACAGAGGTD